MKARPLVSLVAQLVAWCNSVSSVTLKGTALGVEGKRNFLHHYQPYITTF